MSKQKRLWISILLFGLLGQIAWVLENMYFNVFVYNTISTDINIIARMVSLSAITATVTTLLMGYLSDKLRVRKPFIWLGYILWGISLLAFAFINLDNVARWFPEVNAAVAGGWIAVIMDCVMTFFGSTSNDAAFNAWVTDSVDSSNRPKVEGVLAALPLIAMLIVFGVLDGFTQAGKWNTFFIITGSAVSLCGVLGALFLDEPEVKQASTGSLFHGFRPDVIKDNKELYLSFICLLVFSISTQIFMPYMIIYIQNYLGITDYVVILAVVLSGASIVSVLVSRIISILGEDTFYIPSIGLLTVGLLFMFLSRKPAAVMISGLIMMSGNLIVTSLINGTVRNLTPEGQAGHFQGIRMIFAVMLPMIIGPYVGAWVIRDSSSTYIDMGVEKQVPTPAIWLAAAVFAILTLVPYFLLRKDRNLKKQLHNDLYTDFSQSVDPEHPLPEYPRPQMVRDSYINLNGRWDYAIRKQETIPDTYDGTIIVPFSPESLLSGVNRKVTEDDVLIYHRKFSLPADFNRGLVHLHFGAVDQICKVYVNGNMVCEHVGGYLPFEAEISSYLKEENDLVVMVRDYTDTSYYSRGKQSNTRGGIWYTPQSGIWQTVWLESTDINYIKNIRITPDYDYKNIHIEVDTPDDELLYTISLRGRDIISINGKKDINFHLTEIEGWTPENPVLYDLKVESATDSITSYFAMRKVSKEKDKDGHLRIFLNNRPYFSKGVLDQGYWPDGLYTAPTDEALMSDIVVMKEMGFNTLRKHIKIEPLRWYYHCDRLGMLVWQDMVSGGTQYQFATIAALPFINVSLKDDNYKKFSRVSEESRNDYLRELKETVELLYNVPSIILWVPFNEGWGQFDSLKVTDMIREMDPTRLIDHASGWHDQGGGDLFSKHIYFNKITFKPDERITALTEYGGYSLIVEGHTYNNEGYGYKGFKNQQELQEAYKQLHENEIIPLIDQGLSATIYTQVSDVEDEVNGLLTYDRKVRKFDTAFIKEVMDKLTLQEK